MQASAASFDPLQAYNLDQDLRRPATCSVCFELLEESYQADCTQLHNFHIECVRDKWFKNMAEDLTIAPSQKCPFSCKKNVTKIQKNPQISAIAQALAKIPEVPYPEANVEAQPAPEAPSAAASAPVAPLSRFKCVTGGEWKFFEVDRSQRLIFSLYDGPDSFYIHVTAEANETVRFKIIFYVSMKELLKRLIAYNFDQCDQAELNAIQKNIESKVLKEFFVNTHEGMKQLYRYLCREGLSFPEPYGQLISKMIEANHWTQADVRDH